MDTNSSDIAIVIPTLNEEKYIGDLLESLALQTLDPKEIVVVDAFSTDGTIAEIKKMKKRLPQLKYFQIPKYTIARQRNFGARKTTTSHILFLDADMELRDKNTLKKYMDEILQKQPDLAAAINLPNSKYWKDQIYFLGENVLFRISKFIWPMTTTRNLYARRDIFDKVGGFDEKVRVGEDFELVQRIVKRGYKFKFLEKPKVYTSVRRLEKEGRRKFALRMAGSFFYVLRHGYRKNPVAYELGNHHKS